MKKYNYTNCWYKVFSLIFLFAVGVLSATAQSTTVATGDWNTTTALSTPWATSGTGTLPAAGNTVTVNTAITVNGTVANTVGAITIASGGSITFGASGLLNATSVTIQSGGSITIVAGSGRLNAPTVTIQTGGSMVIGTGSGLNSATTTTIPSSGSITIGAGGVLNAASLTIASGGTLDMTAAGTINLTGSLSNSGTYTAGAGVVNYIDFYDNYNRTLTTTPTISAGGTPSVTYTGVASGAGVTKTPGVSLTGTTISMVGNAAADYVTAPFPTPTVVPAFTGTLANNKGLVTWYCSVKPNRTSLCGNSNFYSQVLAATSSDFTTGNGYVVSILQGTTSNKVQLSYYTGGLAFGNLTSLALIDNFVTFATNVNLKVTYNPYTQIWTLAPSISNTDPTLSTAGSTVQSSVDTKYTGSAMTNFGFHMNNTVSFSTLFDNCYIMTTPVVNVTSANSTTAPVTTLTTLSGFTYVQSTAGPSAAQSFYINSGGISNPVTVTVSNSTNWEISKDGTTGWGSSLTYTPASNVINNGITNGNQVFVRLKGSLLASNSPFASDNLAISSLGVAKQTVSLSGTVSNLSTPTALTVASNSDTRQNLTWGTVSTNILVFASTSSAAYTPSGTATSVYTGANAALGSASTYTSGANTYYLVAAGSASSVEVTGLTNSTPYYYQVFSYSGSTYTTAATGTSTNATTAVQPVTGFAASSASTQSVLSWTNPTFNATQSNYWDEVMVIASTTTIVAPSGNGSAYTANAAYGNAGASDANGGYVVYKGTGTGVTVTGLTNFTNYNYSVFVRHGSVWSAASSTTIMALPVSTFTVGDFVSTTSGAYGTNTTWSVWNGTALVASPCTISSNPYTTPGSGNNVWIAGGYSITYTGGTSLPSTANPPSSYVATNSGTYANCNNLYVVNGSLTGTNSTTSTGVSNPIFVSGTDIQVGTNGVIGNFNAGNAVAGNTYNGISLYILNTGTTKIDNYASQTGGSIDVSKLIIYQSASGTPTLEIARNINVHFHSAANGSSGYGLALQNSGANIWTPTATITIDNNATVTMDKWSCIGNYISNSTIASINFTLNVNGILTFTSGTPVTGTNQANATYSNNGYLSMGSTTANTGSAGTGCYLHIGGTGIINTPEFYPNGSNGISSSGIVQSNVLTTGVTIDNGGQLNISAVADFGVAGGQLFSGTGQVNFTGTSTSPTPTMYLGSSAGVNAILPAGTNTFDGTATKYVFKVPTAWAAITAYSIGQQVTSGGNIYTVTTAGTSGTTAPSGITTFTDVVVYAYVSAAAQTTGTALPASVYGLSLSNTAGITLSNATTVTNNYAQTNTILTAASSTTGVLTLNSGVTLPTWNSTNYVAGPVQLYSAANTSAQTLNFPVGTNIEYLPLSLTFTQGAATATAYKVVPTVSTPSHGYASVAGVSSVRYYDITATGNTFSNGSITMSYTATDDDNTISLADATNLRVAEYVSGSNWTNLGGTGTANVTGTITSTNTFTSLGQFAIGNQTVSNAAPTFGTASGATVGANFTIPYTLSSYDAAWQTILLSSGTVTYAGTVLTKNTDYTVTSSGLTIMPNSGAHLAALRTAGTVTITVAATGYTTRTISQSVGAGAASKLAILTQPAASSTADGVVLATSPVVVVQDAYGNTVTSSSATLTASVGTGSSTYFTIGGITTAAATSGVATFTGITAINRSITNVSGYITFSSGSLTPVISGSGITPFTVQKPTTYYWVGTPGNVQNATGWSTTATTLWNTALNGTGSSPTGVNSTDIYEVNGTNIGGVTPTTGSVTLKYSNNLSIGQLRITNGAQVTLSASAASTSNITINGDNGGRTGASTTGDVFVDGTSTFSFSSSTSSYLIFTAGTSLVINTGGTVQLPGGSAIFNTGAIAAINGSLSTTTANVAFATGATGIINGSVTIGTAGGATSIVTVDAGALTFNNGSTCTVNSTLNAFGSSTPSTINSTSYTAGSGSVVFANGSTLTLTKGLDVFGGTRNVTSFGKTSSFIDNYNSLTALLIDGHAFGNLTLNQGVNPSVPGANGFSCNDLNVNSGTFTLSQTGSVSITGNITVASGATLNASPASAVVINLNGTSSTQTVTNSGTLTLGVNTTLNVNNTSGVNMGSNLTSSGVISLAGGSFTVGANTLTATQFSFGSGTLQAGSTSSIVYTGTAALAIPSTISALNGLTISGASTVSTPSTLTSLATLSVSNTSATVNVVGAISMSGALTNTGTISLGTNDITILGATIALTNSGTITSTTGAVNIANTSLVQSIGGAGTGTITNLTINDGVRTVNVSSALNITGKLSVTSGTLNCGAGLLTLKSTSITNTAVVDQVGGKITGTAVVERYIPMGYRAYRDMAPEVYNATSTTGSIFLNWQENGSMTSGKGIFITGTGATHADDGFYGAAYPTISPQPTPASSGLDYSINGNNSAYTYNNGSAYSAASSGYPGFNAITTPTTTNLDVFSGYRVLIRGDRSFNLATTPIVNYYNVGLRMVNATKLRATGNLVYGTVTYGTSGVTATVNGAASATLSTNGLTASTTNGFSMVANPYVCPVQWGTGVTGTQTGNTNTVFGNSSNINGSYWYLDPTAGSTNKYIAFNAITGNATVGGSTYAGSYNGTTNNAAGYIQPGQAFFVQSSSSAPVVMFTESCKAASTANLKAIFGVTKPMSKIYLSLFKEDSVNAYSHKDGAAIAFASSFGNTVYGSQDALKFGNSNDNLYIADKGKNLSIDGRLPATATDILPIALNKMSGKNYQLVVDASIYDATGFIPVLKDNYKGTVKELSLDIDTISFTVDTAIAATYVNRFSLGFKPTTLAVNSLIASATLNNKIAIISWNTVGEKGVSRFEVEKSTDSKSFTKIGQATAKNTATATYTTSDNRVTATTYYRIKAISEVGTVSYSNVAQLTFNSKQFTVYPNPLVGKTLNISFGNIAAGKYIVSINNVLGQKIQEVAISHTGGSASHAITVNNGFAAGTYSVTVGDASGQRVYQSNISVQP